MGQDPYPQPCDDKKGLKAVATGIAFGVAEDQPPQPALEIILDELAVSYYYNPVMEIEDIDRTLISWINQGVLLLNASLTVNPYEPEGVECLFQEGTHSYYWRVVLMEELFKRLNSDFENIIFVFMGQKAQYYNQFIDPEKHTIFNTPHPTADARSGTNLFRGSKIFNRINEKLKEYNTPQIKW